ncbi:unnamed protein product [Zymoseptoria tritici ST99CH_3D7]|uniref:Uncharacterized protein n=1 Tax=Zymoseptoria tritici (strain ST99CH_3D7) TaxID=1276538 RepID=A0A1X7S5C4_ZYMT9|nr:unnamed protein product [Zymoseptoria tritici ST99CH_3D7]
MAPPGLQFQDLAQAIVRANVLRGKIYEAEQPRKNWLAQRQKSKTALTQHKNKPTTTTKDVSIVHSRLLQTQETVNHCEAALKETDLFVDEINTEIASDAGRIAFEAAVKKHHVPRKHAFHYLATSESYASPDEKHALSSSNPSFSLRNHDKSTPVEEIRAIMDDQVSSDWKGPDIWQRLKKRNKDYNTIREQHKTAKSDAERLQERVTAVEADVATATRRADGADDRLGESQKLLEQSQSRLEEVQATLSDLRQKSVPADELSRQLKSQKDLLNTKHESAIGKLQTEHVKNVTEAEAAVRRQLQSEHAGELGKKQVDLDTAQKSNGDLAQRIAELESQLSGLQGKINSLEAQQSNDETTKNNAIEKFRKDAEAAESLASERLTNTNKIQVWLDQEKANTKVIQGKLSDKEATLLDVQKQLDGARTAVTEGSKREKLLRQQLNTANDTAEQTADEIRGLEFDLETQTDEVARLEGVVSDRKADIDTLEKAAADQQKKYEDLERQAADLQTKLEEVQSESDSRNNTIGIRDTSIQDLQSKLAQLDLDLSQERRVKGSLEIIIDNIELSLREEGLPSALNPVTAVAVAQMRLSWKKTAEQAQQHYAKIQSLEISETKLKAVKTELDLGHGVSIDDEPASQARHLVVSINEARSQLDHLTGGAQPTSNPASGLGVQCAELVQYFNNLQSEILDEGRPRLSFQEFPKLLGRRYSQLSEYHAELDRTDFTVPLPRSVWGNAHRIRELKIFQSSVKNELSEVEVSEGSLLTACAKIQTLKSRLASHQSTLKEVQDELIKDHQSTAPANAKVSARVVAMRKSLDSARIVGENLMEHLAPLMPGYSPQYREAGMSVLNNLYIMVTEAERHSVSEARISIDDDSLDWDLSFVDSCSIQREVIYAYRSIDSYFLHVAFVAHTPEEAERTLVLAEAVLMDLLEFGTELNLGPRARIAIACSALFKRFCDTPNAQRTDNMYIALCRSMEIAIRCRVELSTNKLTNMIDVIRATMMTAVEYPHPIVEHFLDWVNLAVGRAGKTPLESAQSLGEVVPLVYNSSSCRLIAYMGILWVLDANSNDIRLYFCDQMNYAVDVAGNKLQFTAPRRRGLELGFTDAPVNLMYCEQSIQWLDEHFEDAVDKALG